MATRPAEEIAGTVHEVADHQRCFQSQEDALDRVLQVRDLLLYIAFTPRVALAGRTSVPRRPAVLQVWLMHALSYAAKGRYPTGGRWNDEWWVAKIGSGRDHDVKTQRLCAGAGDDECALCCCVAPRRKPAAARRRAALMARRRGRCVRFDGTDGEILYTLVAAHCKAEIFGGMRENRPRAGRWYTSHLKFNPLTSSNLATAAIVDGRPSLDTSLMQTGWTPRVKTALVEDLKASGRAEKRDDAIERMNSRASDLYHSSALKKKGARRSSIGSRASTTEDLATSKLFGTAMKSKPKMLGSEAEEAPPDHYMRLTQLGTTSGGVIPWFLFKDANDPGVRPLLGTVVEARAEDIKVNLALTKVFRKPEPEDELKGVVFTEAQAEMEADCACLDKLLAEASHRLHIDSRCLDLRMRRRPRANHAYR